MHTVPLHLLVRYCDRLLKAETWPDYDGALNGLQVENQGHVTRIAAAVDARRATIEAALAQKADLLLVHHGLFWNSTVPWTGRQWALIKLLAQNNLAVYSSHLPLDAHPRLGNSAQVCRAAGLRNLQPFFRVKDRWIGFKSRLKIRREELLARISAATGHPAQLIPGGPPLCDRIGIVTGGAGGELKQAAAEGIDTFVTGEGPHWTHALAEHLRLNVIYGGHYNTETFGVKALARHLAGKFSLPWEFIDYPTGL